MHATAIKSPQQEQTGIEADTVRIGKDVIEILTSGMYVSPVTIYREYIQNSVDAIDAARSRGHLAHGRGQVSVDFDLTNRSVTIRDDGAGINSRDALATLVAIGASPKRGTQARGFRGVGRLSGLAYCRELQFRTKSADDDTITSVTWDCQTLRRRLSDSAFGGDLKRTISDVATVSYEKGKAEDGHFFEVQLLDVIRLRNDTLLNEQLVSNYLAQVAPVAFPSEFSFASVIEDHLRKFVNRLPIQIQVSGRRVQRPYRDQIPLPGSLESLRIEGIELLQYANIDGEIGAVGWIGHHEYRRSISTTLGVRGLRARVGDLQVGETNIFEECFKEPRFNGWSIGEIHVMDRRIVPNARRDDFEINHHYYNLLTQLGPTTAKITQRCRTSSMSRNAEQIVRNVIADVNSRLKQKRGFDRGELSRLKGSVARAGIKAKRIAQSGTKRQLELKLNRIEKKLSKIGSKKRASVIALEEVTSLISRLITNREQARELLEQLQRLCG